MTYEYKYSIDMVKLKARSEKKVVEKLFNSLLIFKQVKYYQEFNFKKYRHNFSITTKDGSASFWLGFQHNSKTSDIASSTADLVMEFNPNKVSKDDFFFQSIYERFFTNYKKGEVTLVSVDVAIDIFGLDNTNVLFDKVQKREVTDMRMSDGSRTIYFGRGYGRTKVYNKKAEVLGKIKKAHEKIENQAKALEYKPNLIFPEVVIPKNIVPEGVKHWTRYEVTLKVDETVSDLAFQGLPEGLPMSLPKIFSVPSQDEVLSMNLKASDEAILWALTTGFPFDRLSRDNKKKFRELLFDKVGIEIDDKKILSTICEYGKELYGLVYESEVEIPDVPEFDGVNEVLRWNLT